MAQSKQQRVKYCAVYVCVCILVAAAALCLAQAAELGFALAARAIAGGGEGGDAAAREGEGGAAPPATFWDGGRVLSAFAATIIALYAGIELRGWLGEGHELPSIRDACRAARSRRCRLARAEGAASPEEGECPGVHVEFKEIDDDNPMNYRDEEAEGTRKTAIGAAGITNVTIESPMINEEARLDEVRPSVGDGIADDEDDEVQATIRAASRCTYALFAVALCGTVDDMSKKNVRCLLS